MASLQQVEEMSMVRSLCHQIEEQNHLSPFCLDHDSEDDSNVSGAEIPQAEV
jgi:hypothetical protein